MNINIPHGRDLQNDNIYGTGAIIKDSRMIKTASEYSIDISGKDKDISAFGMEQLKSFEDIKAKMSTKDVSLESNALAVMSNSMSGEDFAKLQKDGFSPDEMNAEETVTSLDKIKATLAMSGVDIPGYTDDLPTEVIEKITGNKGYALAIESALKENQLPVTKESAIEIADVIRQAEITEKPTDDTKRYMITNDLSPSVSNFYMASHSSSDANAGRKAGYYKDAAGYVGKNPTDVNFDELKPQIEKIISESGIEVNEKTMTESRWLIEKNIPLTKENLYKLQDINQVSFPLDTYVVAKSSAASIADGFSAKDASLTNTESTVTKAARFMNNVTDEIARQEDILKTDGKQNDIAAKRLLEETRLLLTAEASISLIKKGINVDISNLSEVVEKLKQAEKEAFSPFLMEEKYEDVPSSRINEYESELELKLDLYKQTRIAIEDIKAVNEPLVESLVKTADNKASGAVTLSELSKTAKELRQEYEKAEKSYEALMTAPRKDMGDSIKKAFRNVDDILEDMNMEVNKLNEKAVRILGYSGMEINDSNIDKAIKADVAVQNLITNMTPAKVMKMIKAGDNPLEKDIYELSDEITNKDEERDTQKYTEFLYKLEKNGDVTEDEKLAFIGMYRLFRKIEKSDGKLVGDVIKAEEKLTLSNLLSASRSDKHVGTDVKIDDSFGMLEKLVTYGDSITDQILKGFTNKENSEAYSNEEAKNVRDMLTKEEAVLKALDNIGEAESPINIAAVNTLINMRGSLFKSLMDKYEREDEKAEFSENMTELQEGFTDEESAVRAYERFTQKSLEVVKNKIENADTYIDVNSIKLIGKQLTIANKMSKNRTYEIPVEIDGELTSVNLKIVSGSNESGKVTVSYETEATGKVNSEFTLKDGTVSGFITTQNSYFENIAKEKEKSYRSEFENAGVNVSSMYYAGNKSLSIKGNYVEAENMNTPATKQLYLLAKAIIKAVQK